LENEAYFVDKGKAVSYSKVEDAYGDSVSRWSSDEAKADVEIEIDQRGKEQK
jgi:hypothetical protein